MHRLATNVEEQMLVKAIQEEATWESLPKRLKLFLSSKEDWHRKIKEHCIKKRLRWSDCLARTTCKEGEYYEDLMRYLRKSLALFPYHLSENICRIMRISPFRYYCDLLYEIMKNEKPYDSIPNFSAADVLRLTGIGRNEFIDIMNRCRTKKIMWKLNKSIIKEMLPTLPVEVPIEPWWIVSVVNLSLEEYRKLSEDELMTIDKICKDDIDLYGELDPKVVRALYRKGLVYLEVPVFPDDRFHVSNLEGFVSNREQSYEDPTEEILYAVFVASSEHSTIAELAGTLQADIEQVEAAVSLACRLGWANKVVDPSALLNDASQIASDESDVDDFPSPLAQSPLHDDSGVTSLSSADAILQPQLPRPGSVRAALLVDANLTSYLMMGSFSPGLKNHAVKLYEAGKLSDSSVGELCTDLQGIENTKLEGELQQFVDHALSLRYVLECLRSGGGPASEDNISNTDGDSEATNLEFKFNLLQQEQNIPDLDKDRDVVQQQGKPPVRSKKVRRYRVDVLRCESLAGLASGTMQRVFERDYDIVVSMVPLASPPALVTSSDSGNSPVHFGPPSRAAVTPWMKLLLYNAMECGPVSVVLIRGVRFRQLPPILKGCGNALIWTWDGNNYDGIGGKLEGSMVPGNILLHCLNSILRHSAVLVQPFRADSPPATMDIPLPLQQGEISGGGPLTGQRFFDIANELFLTSTAGYLRLVRTDVGWVPQAVEFGIPLSDTKLCKGICEAVVSSEIFNVGYLPKHQQAMQRLKKKLHEFVIEYHSHAHAPGLTVIPSGRWMQADLPSPSTETAKSVYNRRRRSEILSFDGDILRSGGAIYEAKAANESGGGGNVVKMEVFRDDVDGNEVSLPSVNLVFDGGSLLPFDDEIASCLQAGGTAATEKLISSRWLADGTVQKNDFLCTTPYVILIHSDFAQGEESQKLLVSVRLLSRLRFTGSAWIP